MWYSEYSDYNLEPMHTNIMKCKIFASLNSIFVFIFKNLKQQFFKIKNGKKRNKKVKINEQN